ncbi:metal-dependent transcriptional regulator [Caldisericum exile]|uniref:Transcriptional regulator MntR n=1 Tax=Caldisericum exile (strain DSM 21853 / NBRC 104410 / AZM16c01) TaxID=511051 RepID=A0A7U6JGJ7_CALEA|nr:metal-dependent transcriptional regulator [Caldisericum exile]BAL81590.1 putative transcriptional regulator [Caldisericum exile AZM16c01]
MQYTKSIEDYLEAIFVVREQKGYVRVKDIADLLNVKLPSVTEIIKKMQESGLIEHTPYGEIKLTEIGENVGRNVWQKHKALYEFLKDYLKVDDDTAFKEACLIEHSVSQDTIEKLKEFLKNLEEK